MNPTSKITNAPINFGTNVPNESTAPCALAP
jgi:hypothetical protein